MKPQCSKNRIGTGMGEPTTEGHSPRIHSGTAGTGAGVSIQTRPWRQQVRKARREMKTGRQKPK